MVQASLSGLKRVLVHGSSASQSITNTLEQDASTPCLLIFPCT
jgi:hypothetical protein